MRPDGTSRFRLTSLAPRATRVTFAIFSLKSNGWQTDDPFRETSPARSPRWCSSSWSSLPGCMQPGQGSGAGLGAGRWASRTSRRADAGFFWANQPRRFPCADGLGGGPYRLFRHGKATSRTSAATSPSPSRSSRPGGSATAVRCSASRTTTAGSAPPTAAPRASFPDADTGVRAQIQHLRAYADPSATSCSVAAVGTRRASIPVFDLVSPKGKAPNWNDMGNGNWATDPDYASKVIDLYNRMRTYAGSATGLTPPQISAAGASPVPVGGRTDFVQDRSVHHLDVARTSTWSIWLCGRCAGHVRPRTARRQPGSNVLTAGPHRLKSPTMTGARSGGEAAAGDRGVAWAARTESRS